LPEVIAALAGACLTAIAMSFKDNERNKRENTVEIFKRLNHIETSIAKIEQALRLDSDR